MNDNFQKIIWFLWLQGKDNMPELINYCYNSWLKHNPDWKIIFLDKNNLIKYLDKRTFTLIQNTKFSKAASMSDIIRINLLKNHGGVWTDSTTYCCKPLNDWLFDYMENGFFAFASPQRANTLISSWFLAANKSNYIVEKYNNYIYNYWDENKNMKLWRHNKLTHALVRGTFLIKYFDKNPQRWFSPFIRQKLKWHPYFWFHYLFEKAYLEDERFKALWDSNKKITADIPHKLQHYGLTKPISEELKLYLKTTETPLYKLNRRIKLNKKNTVIIYLLRNSCNP
jgi:hypothetical protein